MTMHKNINLCVTGCLLLIVTSTVFAKNNQSAEFFVSNNTGEINVQTAYDRLMGQEQDDLENSMIQILQKNHIEQGKFQDILGMYRMSSDQNMTADNTEYFKSSPYQHLSDEKIFSIAKKLAVTFNQDSVAVLIPDKSQIGDVTVTFITRQPGIEETISMLHDKLPASYNQAFSLHLSDEYSGFDNAKVSEIEWLGSSINSDEIKKVFPLEKIDHQDGKVFLVYQNGQKEQL